MKSAISAEPTRSDYRLKLLELYKEATNLTAFDNAYRDLIDLDDDAAIARAGTLRAAIPGAANSPFAFGVSSAAAAAGITDEVDFDFDLDMDLPEEAPVAPAALEPVVDAVIETAPPVAETAPSFDMDFDLDTPVVDSPVQTSIREAVSVADSSVAEAPAAEAVVEAAAEEAFSLDFDLDLELPAEEAPALELPELEMAESVAAPTPVYTEEETALLDAVTADAGDVDEELGFLSDADEAATKLDLARAYIDMGDKEGARDILAEVLEEGRDEQKREAQALLDSIG